MSITPIKSRQVIEFLFIIAVLSLALVVLTPRYWEPSQENWHKWAAARILWETGEFPPPSMGPLYVAYLLPFSLIFKYPFSVTLEYWITHLFSYTAIYLLLQHFIRRRYALLLTIAWIPHLATVEPGGAILGIGLICWYFLPGKSPLRNKSYLPPALVAAGLSHTVYFIFLVGHLIGTFLENRRGLSAANSSSFLVKNKSGQRLPARTLTAMLLLLGLAVMIIPFSAPDRNHILMDPTYVPIPLDNPVKTAFFVLGTERYVRRTFPEQEWVYQDWYLSTPQAYGGATTITQAIIRKPETVSRNFITNLASGLQLPLFLLSGAFLGPIALLFLFFPLFGFVGLRKKWKEERNYPQLWSVIIGTSCALIVLALTNFNAARYVATLLPVGFLLLIHTSSGFSIVTKYWANQLGLRAEKYRIENVKKVDFRIIGSGILLILLGLAADEQVIHQIVLQNQELPMFILRQIEIARMSFIVIGAILLLFNKKINFYREKIKGLIQDRPERLSLILQKADLNGTKYLVVTSAILLLLTVHYPFGIAQQFQSVFQGKAFLSGLEPVSLADAYPELQKHLNANTAVLTREYTWVMAFTEVKLDNVYQIWSLPPFPDLSGETEKKLRGLDAIFVSFWLESARPNPGTQTYPRYIFHLKPFLEKARREGWKEEKIRGYGTIYLKEET